MKDDSIIDVTGQEKKENLFLYIKQGGRCNSFNQ